MKKGIMEYVLALQDCGYPAAAAQKCGVSPSTLISSIKRMESELGVLLYDRGARKFTRAGSIYVDICREIIKEDQRLRRELALLKPQRLTVGYASYVDRRVTSLLFMGMFSAPDQNAGVRIIDCPSDALPAELLEGEMDLFLGCEAPSPSRRALFIPVLSVPLFLAAPPDCPVDPRDPLKSVSALKMISMFQGTILQQHQMTLDRGTDEPPDILMETNSAVITDNLVSRGGTYTIVNIGMSLGLPHSKLYPIPNSQLTMGMWVLKERLPQLKKIHDRLLQCAEELYGQDPNVTLLFERKGGGEHVPE